MPGCALNPRRWPIPWPLKAGSRASRRPSHRQRPTARAKPSPRSGRRSVSGCTCWIWPRVRPIPSALRSVCRSAAIPRSPGGPCRSLRWSNCGPSAIPAFARRSYKAIAIFFNGCGVWPNPPRSVRPLARRNYCSKANRAAWPCKICWPRGVASGSRPPPIISKRPFVPEHPVGPHPNGAWCRGDNSGVFA